ncbi:MAG: type I pullulanase [Epulopiscium sp. Nuni2H_MBin003]|nr:MAG: type I pullulanase [Epulopiscium sp. Nuni2H_MBin003]
MYTNVVPKITTSYLTATLLDNNIVEIVLPKYFYGGQAEWVALRCEGDLTYLKKLGGRDHADYVIYKYSCENSIDYTKDNVILINNGTLVPLNVEWVTKFSNFDELYYYDGNDLGSTYTPENTMFKVWAPIATKVKVEIELNGQFETYELTRQDRGVWTTTVYKNLDGCSYVYLLRVNNDWTQATDPYAYSGTANSERSSVIDLAKIQIERPNLEQVDAIICEMHVRDFSMSETSGIVNKGKFLGVIEEGTTTPAGNSSGFDYVKQLGITHVQIQPFFDFASVEELHQSAYYNWGYDPMQYNIPEGSYSTNPNEPYSRVVELQQMISKFHQNGIRVIMDVVYNHVFDMGAMAFQKIVPNYYFRFDADQNQSNGSYCGNDIETTALMCRKYIIDSCLRWINIYGVDGFRFDLMGIIDIDTMNELRAKCDAIDSNILIYGEGWNMPSTLSEEKRASMYNQLKFPSIGHFNDRFRDNIKQIIAENTVRDAWMMDTFKQVLTGTLKDIGNAIALFSNIEQCINYVECHDNSTLQDYMQYENGLSNLNDRQRRATFAMVLVMLSQGTPFFQLGQEFFRTKQGVENSYKSHDYINQIDWSLRDKYYDNIEMFKKIIQIRKDYPHFKLQTDEIEECVEIKYLTQELYLYSITKDGVTIDIYINMGDTVYDSYVSDSSDVLLDTFENIYREINKWQIKVVKR